MIKRFRVSVSACRQGGQRRFVGGFGLAAIFLSVIFLGVHNAPPVSTFLSSARAEQADRIVAIGGAVT